MAVVSADGVSISDVRLHTPLNLLTKTRACYTVIQRFLRQIVAWSDRKRAPGQLRPRVADTSVGSDDAQRTQAHRCLHAGNVVVTWCGYVDAFFGLRSGGIGMSIVLNSRLTRWHVQSSAGICDSSDCVDEDRGRRREYISTHTHDQTQAWLRL